MYRGCDLLMLKESSLGMLVTMRAHYFASDMSINQKMTSTGKENNGSTCMITLRSAFPVRMSYNVNVRSEPMLARTDDSLRLKRTAVIVSVDVGKVKLDIGALLSRCMHKMLRH